MDTVVISDAFGVKKPAREIFCEVVRRLDIVPDQSWFLGDHPVNDVWGSKQVGFRSGWVRRGQVWPAELEPCFDAASEQLSDLTSAIALQLQSDE